MQRIYEHDSYPIRKEMFFRRVAIDPIGKPYYEDFYPGGYQPIYVNTLDHLFGLGSSENDNAEINLYNVLFCFMGKEDAKTVTYEDGLSKVDEYERCSQNGLMMIIAASNSKELVDRVLQCVNLDRMIKFYFRKSYHVEFVDQAHLYANEGSSLASRYNAMKSKSKERNYFSVLNDNLKNREIVMPYLLDCYQCNVPISRPYIFDYKYKDSIHDPS